MKKILFCLLVISLIINLFGCLDDYNKDECSILGEIKCDGTTIKICFLNGETQTQYWKYFYDCSIDDQICFSIINYDLLPENIIDIPWNLNVCQISSVVKCDNFMEECMDRYNTLPCCSN